MSVQKSNSGSRMSDGAVAAKTGKNWSQWFALLNKSGAKKMSHKEIVKLLNDKYDVGPWWCQMVTVIYEQQSGLRESHERPDGYQISVSRTLNNSISDLFKSFENETLRSAWLSEDGLRVRKSTKNRSMRVTWKDGKTSLEINFYPKATNKSQVVVQHSKLPSASAAARMKNYWSKALDRLQTTLE